MQDIASSIENRNRRHMRRPGAHHWLDYGGSITAARLRRLDYGGSTFLTSGPGIEPIAGHVGKAATAWPLAIVIRRRGQTLTPPPSRARFQPSARLMNNAFSLPCRRSVRVLVVIRRPSEKKGLLLPEYPAPAFNCRVIGNDIQPNRYFSIIPLIAHASLALI
jgi:hypothetical protein